MSNFPQKHFLGATYAFTHLKPIVQEIPLQTQKTSFLRVHVTFGCHCFTEEFDHHQHQQHHRYVYKGELRAFDLLRYECSLELPKVIGCLLRGRVYLADESYTYAAQITIESAAGPQGYCVFFSLEKDTKEVAPAVRMFVKSAYLRPTVVKQNAQGWRFVSWAGQLSGAFTAKEKKPRPKKKKAP